VNPYSGSFSAFVKALSSDSELLDKQVILKTDTTNYLLKGYYKVFNPFSINAEKVEMIFAGQPEVISSKKSIATMLFYNYQITAYFDDTPLNRKMVLKDYNKIKRKANKEMNSEINSLKGVQKIEDGEIADFYFSRTSIYPLLISWQTLSISKKLALTIIAKLAVTNNHVHLAGIVPLQFSAISQIPTSP